MTRFSSHSSSARPLIAATKRRAVLALALAAAVCTSAQAQDDKQQPLRIIVATAPGGVPDVLARIIAQQMTEDSGRTVIVENRLGAGGMIALNALTNSQPDGTAVVLIESGSYAIAPHMTKNNPFGEGVAPVALVATAPIYLSVNSGLGVNNLKDFIALARSKPGLPYGSSGNGSSHHLAMELFKSRAKVDLTHIPYKGAGQAVIATVSGEVAVSFLGLSTALPQAKAGKLKILGVASAERNPLTPDIPSIAEVSGLDFDVRISLGLFANSKTPPAVIDSLNKAFGKATRSPNVRTRLAQIGIESSDGKAAPKEFAAMVKNEYDFYGRLVDALKLKID